MQDRSQKRIEYSRLTGSIAFAGASTALASFALLHVLRSDLDPGWHVASEYALGEFGWLMTLCFLSLAAGCAALAAGLFPRVRGIGARIGLGLLALATVGLVLAALNPMDLLATRPEAATLSGRLHELAGLLGVPGLAGAALLLGLVLRGDPRWGGVRKPLVALAHLNWISMLLMYAILALLVAGFGRGGPGLIGWANRLSIVANCTWVMTAAWPLVRRAGREFHGARRIRWRTFPRSEAPRAK
ncbi:MAG: DUF998 domain-containing protein [Planctomycetes bacterium]|nr:DUF998 domain-containing protein [Planctomycetota bacterium]